MTPKKILTFSKEDIQTYKEGSKMPLENVIIDGEQPRGSMFILCMILKESEDVVSTVLGTYPEASRSKTSICFLLNIRQE